MDDHSQWVIRLKESSKASNFSTEKPSNVHEIKLFDIICVVLFDVHHIMELPFIDHNLKVRFP